MIDPKVIIPAVLIGLNELLKKIGMNDRWCPLVNLVGGFIAMPFLLESYNIYNSILLSLIIGLSAGGFYDLGQKTVRGL
jgi:hypothetical protein